MGLKSFLQQQGFIEDDPADKIKEKGGGENNSQQAASTVPPTFFPFAGIGETPAATAASDPSFVSPLQTGGGARETADPIFIKFFEDELVKANLPGPDYFEFRQLLIKTQQKMASKGMVAPEVVLQAVMMSFEAQDVPPVKLIEAAKQYKDLLKQKNDDFLKGANAEKNNQLQKRQSVLQSHNDAVQKIQQQLQQLELQKQQLEQSMNKEKTQMEVSKTLGKEGIEKIEKAEKMIALAHDYIQSTIDADIKRLQTV
ncbi:MAG: hypothetical protein JWQ30_1447 [Sediminibacterium sp.]|nr:hypothetical protein [Sediminibacterium sp.]